MIQVLIVGAGPVGLMLASELTLQGVRAVIVERLARPTGLSKALGVQGRGVDLLAARGLLSRFPVAPWPAGVGLHLAGIPLEAAGLSGPRPGILFVAQPQTEAILEARARELGVEIRRGEELLGLEQNGDRVTVRLRGDGDGATERSLTADYVVGCDGGRSTVRKAAGIEFPGSEPTTLWRMADVRLPGSSVDAGGLRLADGSRPALGMAWPLDNGYCRVITREPFAPTSPSWRDTPMTLDEFSASVRRAYGLELAMAEPRWLTRFTDAARQAASYRKGCVFLAGDAAHVHLPAGGPGISTGIGDAANLAWKLAATLHGWAPPALLDSYHAERHPVGARVLLHTQAQSALMTPTANVLALRTLFAELLRLPDTLTHVADLLQGTEIQYSAGAHPLVGRWMPEPIALESARPVLLDGDGSAVRTAERWRDRVEARAWRHPTLAALLVRPDGYVAWAADHGAVDHAELEAALQSWFGEAR